MGIADFANLSLSSQVGGTVLGVAGGLQESFASAQASRYQAGIAENNRRLALLQAEEVQRRAGIASADALERGQKLQLQVARDTRQLEGRQRAALAANGVVVDEGSAADIVSDTQDLGLEDQQTVVENAMKEAHAIQIGAMDTATALQNQAANFQAQSDLLETQATNTTISGFLGAGSTLLTGGFNVGQTLVAFEQQGVPSFLT